MSKLLESLAVLAELTGTEWSKPAIRVIEQELLAYPEADVLVALRRCQTELRGRVTLADILQRIPGGHPGAEEAWSIVAPKVQSDVPTIFVTDPMREAYGAALMLENDMVAARMAFKETYTQAVRRAESDRRRPTWSMIPGTDANGKTLAIEEAVKKGIAKLDWAMRQLPVNAHDSLLALAEQTDVKRLRLA